VLFVTGGAIHLLAHGALWLAGVPLYFIGGFMLATSWNPNPERYWKRANVMWRLVGFWSAFIGCAFIAWGLHDYVYPDAAPANGAPAWISFVIGGAVVSFGAMFLVKPATRPDLGDHMLSDRWMRVFRGLPSNWERPKVTGREHRTWWTGDTKPPASA